MEEREKGIINNITEKTNRIQILNQKQGINKQFKTKEERDKWIKNEISILENAIVKKEQTLQNIIDEIEKLKLNKYNVVFFKIEKSVLV